MERIFQFVLRDDFLVSVGIIVNTADTFQISRFSVEILAKKERQTPQTWEENLTNSSAVKQTFEASV